MSSRTIQFSDVPVTEFTMSFPDPEEKQSLNFEFQGGMELMFWLSELNVTELTKEITLDSLEKAFIKLDKAEFPIAEYNGFREASFALAIVFGEQLRSQFGWEWTIVDNNPNIDAGWSVISNDKKYGFNPTHSFFRKMLINQPIQIKEIYHSIEKLVADSQVDEGKTRFISLNYKKNEPQHNS